ncbi:MAG: hypothetical protein E5Y79_16635 [Mesorhizobium sp.]|nr:MAG: hypothetical protein E5Y79_16635 [Mesorhizobium sp.]
MRGAPAWHWRHSVQHLSSVSALRADPPSPTRGEGRGRLTGLTFRARCLCVAPSFPRPGGFPVLQRPRLHEHNGLIQWPKPQTSRSSFCRPPTPVSST